MSAPVYADGCEFWVDDAPCGCEVVETLVFCSQRRIRKVLEGTRRRGDDVTFVLIVMAMVVIAALAAIRQSDTTQDLDSRPADVPARAREGTRAGAGWEDTKPAPVPEASEVSRTAALRLVRSPRQDVTQPTPDDGMAEFDRELELIRWDWSSPPDNAA